MFTQILVTCLNRTAKAIWIHYDNQALPPKPPKVQILLQYFKLLFSQHMQNFVYI